jgi:hypothetical protein
MRQVVPPLPHASSRCGALLSTGAFNLPYFIALQQYITLFNNAVSVTCVLS